RRFNHMIRIHHALIAAAAFAAAACQDSQPATTAAAPAPPAVAVVSVQAEKVEMTGEWLATLDGNVNAQIRPQVSGYLVKRNYREGAVVRRGDVLFEIDRRTFESALLQAKARLAESRAQLAKADRDITRDRPLAEQRAIAQSQLDNDISARDAAQASVESAQAAVETSELNLGFTRVTALTDGVAAIATAQIGDLVGPTTLLTTVSQLDPIKAYFPLTEQEYLGIAGELAKSGGPAKLWQAAGGLVLVLADGSTHPKRGAVLAVDRGVDPKMGTIRISATFPNPGNVLRPGQGARVRAQTGVRTDALLVPQRAVSELQNGYQIRVLMPDNRVATRAVTLGRRVGSRWVVDKGLSAGDQVIVEGAATKDGALVSPHPFTAPAGSE
ncbi:MAG: efflux RND transporter periplasmic adaptor subunit, partial [Acidobacteriota bacterium]